MNIPGYLAKDRMVIAALTAIAFLIYYPVFTSNYLYADEAVQLWNYRPGSAFHMFIEQGRYLTDRLMSALFGRAETIADLRYLRIISFAGWLFVIPVWYTILKKIFVREQLPVSLVPILVLWLICSPTVTISIAWASCMELFIAYTAGLLSGYLAYTHLRYEHEVRSRKGWVMPLVTVLGLISLFTYQNGFGCFLIPFFIHAVANPGRYQKIAKGLIAFAIISAFYYLLFKYQLKALAIVPNGRTAFGFDIIQKIKFFIFRPLSSSFHLGFLFNEQDRTGVLVFAGLMLLTLLGTFKIIPGLLNRRAAFLTDSPHTDESVREKGQHAASEVRRDQSGESTLKATVIHSLFLFMLCMFIYFPSLVVKENFSSNRTLLALSFTVCCWVLITLWRLLPDPFFRRATFLVLTLAFVCNGFFNYNCQFRKPVQAEYQASVKAFDSVYQQSLSVITVRRPPENQFQRRYGITRSWDEFGVPSLFFPWVPEPYFRQLMLERSGDRTAADRLTVHVEPQAP